MMHAHTRLIGSVLAAALLLSASPAGAQTPAPPQPAPGSAATPATSAAPVAAPVSTIPRWARVSFFTHAANTTQDDGSSVSFSEVITNVAAHSAQRPDGGFEYGLDARFGAYPSSEDREQRVSIYDAYVAQRLAGGRLLVKGGQMWLNDLGALGSVGGGLVEYRQAGSGSGLRWRAGVFGGVEPKILELGYVTGVRKLGGYVAVDGNGARKHVVGYVNIRNETLTERSVVTMTNYIPVRQQVFVYQALEYDLSGPGGQGDGGLTYFFVNARVAPVRRADLQFTYHHGRSIDARSITDDILNGRPVNARTLEGYLFESVNGRVTVEVLKNLRVFAGYGQDKNGSGDDATGRVTFGLFSSDLFGTGIDLNVSDYRYHRGTESSYDSWYVSVGRSLGSKLYLTGEYSSSLSVLRYTQSSGLVIETRPSTDRFGANALVYLSRRLSLLVTGEHTTGDAYDENRVLAGLVCRF
jgi:hypothetical protein